MGSPDRSCDANFHLSRKEAKNKPINQSGQKLFRRPNEIRYSCVLSQVSEEGGRCNLKNEMRATPADARRQFEPRSRRTAHRHARGRRKLKRRRRRRAPTFEKVEPACAPSRAERLRTSTRSVRILDEWARSGVDAVAAWWRPQEEFGRTARERASVDRGGARSRGDPERRSGRRRDGGGG